MAKRLILEIAYGRFSPRNRSDCEGSSCVLEHADREGLRRLRRREVAQVFPTSVGTPIEPRSLNRHFDGVSTRAGPGLAGVGLHNLRHTVVTRRLELGTSPHVV